MGIKMCDFGNEVEMYAKQIHEIGKMLIHRIAKPWLYPDFIYKLFGYQRKLDKYLKPAHNFTKSIIAKRKQQIEADIANGTTNEKENEDPDRNAYVRPGKRRYAMLDSLLQAQRDGLIDDEGIQEETDTFTFGGHDTTTSGLTFAMLLLAHHPEAQEKILEEINEALEGNATGELTKEDFNNMNYLDRAIKECLRIYPPIAEISRAFTEDFTTSEFIR